MGEIRDVPWVTAAAVTLPQSVTAAETGPSASTEGPVKAAQEEQA